MNVDIITEYQKRINNLMEKYEETTRQLLDCDIDDVLMLTQKRQNISEEITAIDNKVRLECIDEPLALSAYLNKCGRNELPDELTAVFDLRQDFNSIAFRVREMEPEIRERIVIMRDELINKIKKNNASHDAKAAKYGQVGVPSGDKMFFPENKKMI